jgi:hypothetical protein
MDKIPTVEEFIDELGGRFVSPYEADQIALFIAQIKKMDIKPHCESTTADSWVARLDHSGHDEETCPFAEYNRHVCMDSLKIGIGSCAHQVQCFHAGFIRG